jgi:hypothetical protein
MKVKIDPKKVDDLHGQDSIFGQISIPIAPRR